MGLKFNRAVTVVLNKIGMKNGSENNRTETNKMKTIKLNPIRLKPIGLNWG